VQSGTSELPGSIIKVIVRNRSDREADQGAGRELDALYIYIDAFVFDQDFGRMLPFYKVGKERSYLCYEFVLDKRVYADGIVGLQHEATTKGFRSLHAMRSAELKKLIDTILRHHRVSAPLVIRRD
jgi:hypothetical protein